MITKAIKKISDRNSEILLFVNDLMFATSLFNLDKTLPE